ncbi:MAG: PEP-CTERM sorting domain-containing protein [Verrucomicrobiota bacterium JB022]|nr:PEP-CTERM sorting domain-containing protein [Verrucomicrobiota bacterium JB022]
MINISITDAGAGQILLAYSGSNTFDAPFSDAFIRYQNTETLLIGSSVYVNDGPVGDIMISVDGGTAFAPYEIEMVGLLSGGNYLGARAGISGNSSIVVSGSTLLNVDYSNFIEGSTTVTSPVGPITLTVGTPVVPEPTTVAALMGAAALGFVAVQRRRKA